MTHAYPPSDRSTDRPPSTGGLSIADRRIVTAMARDVATIRRWVAFFGAVLVCALIAGGVALVLFVGVATGWWHLTLR